MESLEKLAREIRACTLCQDQLENGVRPVIQVSSTAKILIAGQAPGTKVHASGIPFDDASGDRLRQWMGVSREQFYDPSKIAIAPMAFCYPGRGKSGDLPPMPICAQTWRSKLLSALTGIQFTLIIGQYAQAWHLARLEKNLTQTVKAWRSYPNDVLPLPHPSPRNNIWLAKNQWFENDVLPHVKQKVLAALSDN